MAFEKLQQLESGFVYIWVWHADKVPPHIGCSINQSYFSLKVNGLDLHFPVKRALAIIEQKGIPCLFIQTSIRSNELELGATFEAHATAISQGQSCLTPVKKAVAAPEGIEKIKDLISYLEEHDEIKHIFGLNLNESFVGIPDYSMEDIQQRLQYLRNVKR